MGIVINKSIKTVFITYIGIGLGIINTIYLFPLVLSAEEIGLTRTIINISTLFATFASLGSFTLPMKYFPYFRDHKSQHNGFLFFIFSIGFVGFCLFVVLLSFFQSTIVHIYQENSKLLVGYFYLFIPCTAAILFHSTIESYLVVLSKPVVPNALREIGVRLLFSFSLVAYSFGIFNQNKYFLNIFFIYLMIDVLLIAYTYRTGELFFKPQRAIFRGPYFNEMAVFCSFVLLGNVSGLILQNIDTLVLSAYSGLKQTGIYSIAFFIATFIDVPKRSLSQVLIPLISTASKENDVPTIENIYKKSSINQLLIGGGILILIWINIDQVFSIIPHSSIYTEGKWVVLIIGVAKLFDMTTGVNGEIIGTSKYYKYDLLFLMLLTIIGTGTSLILVPRYGMNGAAFATGFAIIVFNIMRTFFVYLLYKIHPFSFPTLLLLLILFGSVIINYFISAFENTIIDIIVRSTIVGGMILSSTLFLNISPEITHLFQKLLYRIKK